VHRVVLVVVALLASAAPASAQIVNVQGALAAEPEPGWSGTVSAGVDWQTGNTELTRIYGAGSALYRTGPWLGLVLARGEYSEGEGVTLAERSFEHLRARRALDARWSWEALAQHEYDAFRRLAVRAVAGTGPALQLVRTERASLACGAAYLLEREQRSELDGAADSGLRAWHHRLSMYLTGRGALGAGVSATQTVYVQPRLDTTDDLMLLSETAVESKLSSRVSLINSLVVAYDADPAETVEGVSTALRVSIAFTF
jgi:hypothetical protein